MLLLVTKYHIAVTSGCCKGKECYPKDIQKAFLNCKMIHSVPSWLNEFDCINETCTPKE